MDLQVRKIHFVQEFLRLNNEQIVNKLEGILKTEKSKLYNDSPKILSMDEFDSMIDKAEDDSKNNRIKSAHELKNDIKSWI